MTSLDGRGIAAILLDIEGTTTPIAFVHERLFPYARTHLHSYLSDVRNAGDLARVVALLRDEHAADRARGVSPPDWIADTPEQMTASVEAHVLWLMDQDRKSPGLKLLQGYVWEQGYQKGELRGEVFPDTAGAIRRWHDANLDVAIYSSGSVLAQRRLFESTTGGDLTPLIKGFFDTAVGPKTSPESYARIARTLGRTPAQVLFVSDVTAELDAAKSVGMHVVLSIRPGNPSQSDAPRFETIRTFDEISG